MSRALPPWRKAAWIALAAFGVVASAVIVAAALRGGKEDGGNTVTAATKGRVTRPAPRPNSYVGSEACRECHAEISRRYDGHPMARSLARTAEAPVVEDYASGRFERAGRSYRVERTADKVVHYEAMVGTDGEPLYDQGVEVAYALGSGRRGRGYVIDRGGLLFLSPVSWYTGRNGWDLSPGYRPESHPRFERRGSHACLGCHSGRMNSEPGTDRYREPPFLEEGIGCERCHGPGGEHVARYRPGAAANTVADTIVNPGRLDPARREAVCQQCHLQGEERILRYGRSEEDFRPGDRLEDIWAVFVRGTGLAENGTTQAVNQVEQMRSSRCYAESGGKLGCVSCHDPHGVPADEGRAAFFDARCRNCHADPDGPAAQAAASVCSLPREERVRPPASGSCIHCHMPKLSAGDVPHTSQSDHRILRRPSEEDAAKATDEGPPELFDGANRRLPKAEVARAEGLRLIRATGGSADDVSRAATFLRDWVATVSDDAEVLEALGEAAESAGRTEQAIGYYRRAVEAAPGRESSLERLARLYQRTDRAAESLAVMDRLIALNPWIAEYHGTRAYLLARLGRLSESSNAAERALELNPSSRRTYRSMAELRRAMGDAEGAERFLRLFSRFPPE